MVLSDDPWIADNSIIDPERLHALGLMTLFWNHCEENLFHLFCLTFDFPPKVGRIIAHDLGDIAICERIKEMLKLVKTPKVPSTLLLNALDVYDKCRINRNTLTHFITVLNEDGGFSFMRMKGPSTTRHPLPCSLEDVRRVASEVQTLSDLPGHFYLRQFDAEAIASHSNRTRVALVTSPSKFSKIETPAETISSVISACADLSRTMLSIDCLCFVKVNTALIRTAPGVEPN